MASDLTSDAPHIDQIVLQSAEDLSILPDESVDLTVTSPPYWNAIDYDVHTRGKNEWYRSRQYDKGYSDYADYLAWLEGVFRPLVTKTKPGGYCGVVIGTVLLNGDHYPLPFDFTSLMVKWGWRFHQDFVWHKVTGGVKRAGVFIQKPYPGYFYPNIMTEYILVFRKEGPSVYSGRDESERDAAKVPIDDLFKKELANTVWHIAPVPPGHVDHPCPFPEEIPFRLIQLYTYEDGLVFDPFVGSGQTTKVAHHMGRRFLGLDIEQRYVQYARDRLNESLFIRKEQLLAVFEKLQYRPKRVLRTENLPLFQEK
ncbi:MAG: site-specific DNA-methyltransferase [Phycisphaerae bacterium]